MLRMYWWVQMYRTLWICVSFIWFYEKCGHWFVFCPLRKQLYLWGGPVFINCQLMFLFTVWFSTNVLKYCCNVILLLTYIAKYLEQVLSFLVLFVCLFICMCMCCLLIHFVCTTDFFLNISAKTWARILDGWLSSINWLFKSVDYNKREISASCYCVQSLLDVSYCTRWITLISRLL